MSLSHYIISIFITVSRSLITFQSQDQQTHVLKYIFLVLQQDNIYFVWCETVLNFVSNFCRKQKQNRIISTNHWDTYFESINEVYWYVEWWQTKRQLKKSIPELLKWISFLFGEIDTRTENTPNNTITVSKTIYINMRWNWCIIGTFSYL